MTRLAIAPRAWQFLALVPIVLMSAIKATTLIVPDIIMATCLMLFLYQTSDPRLLTSKTRCFLCGVTAGVAYLAKAYALPFSLAFFVVAAVLRYLIQRRRGTAPAAGDSPAVSLKGLAGALAVGVLGCALVSGPWIGAMSLKFGHLTISSAASWNHAFLCPPGHEAGPAFQIGEGLRPALDGRFSFWDDTGEIPRTDWSPFADTQSFVHQLHIMVKNAELVVRVFVKYDWLCLSLVLIGLSPWLAWRLRQQRGILSGLVVGRRRPRVLRRVSSDQFQRTLRHSGVVAPRVPRVFPFRPGLAGHPEGGRLEDSPGAESRGGHSDRFADAHGLRADR